MEWAAFASIEPFGEMGEWLRMGILASTIVNIQGKEIPKGRPAIQPKQFMTPYDLESDSGVKPGSGQQMSNEAINAVFMSMVEYGKMNKKANHGG